MGRYYLVQLSSVCRRIPNARISFVSRGRSWVCLKTFAWDRPERRWRYALAMTIYDHTERVLGEPPVCKAKLFYKRRR